MKSGNFKLKAISQVVTLSVMGALNIQHVHAAEDKAADITSIGASTEAGAYLPEIIVQGTALGVAPVQASLEATQPESIITRDYISLSVTPIAEYSRIVNIAPSLSGDSANGPGLSETKTTLRGFQDDEYNITFDGIPWGDTNNPAHHSTSFFPASTIGGATVERGPGNASNIGFATFGGSINLYSKKPSVDPSSTLFSSFGTWGTRLLGAGWESGQLSNMGDTTIQTNYQDLKSDGYLSNSPIRSRNLTVKLERPFGDSTVVTLFSTFNKIKYYQPDKNKGATLDQIAAFGQNFQLDLDPTSMNYKENNFTTKDTDFSYLRVRSELGGGWNTDAYVYTYAYDNQTRSTTDPKWTGTSLSLAQYKDPRFTYDDTRKKIVGTIPGVDKQNQYRDIGGLLKVSKSMTSGLFRTGVWYDTSDSDRHQYDINMSQSPYGYNRAEKVVNGDLLAGTNRPIDSIKFEQQSAIHSLQPFAEFEWEATDKLKVTPGIKLVHITRNVDSPVEQTSRELNHISSLTYKSTLPFLTANYRINDGLAAYAQLARGYQIPDLKTFYIAHPEQNSTEPQMSTNYQLGLVSRSREMTWDIDVYRINFTNKYVSNNLPGDDEAFINIGGATYEGVEGQVSHLLGNGFSVSANGSVNRAISNDTNKQISSAPNMTASLGSLYVNGPWSASLQYKRTGKVHQADYACDPACNDAYYDFYTTPAYGSLDFGVSYLLQPYASSDTAIKFQLNVFNLTDDNTITSVTPGDAVLTNSKLDTFVFHAPRSIMLSMNVEF